MVFITLHAVDLLLLAFDIAVVFGLDLHLFGDVLRQRHGFHARQL